MLSLLKHLVYLLSPVNLYTILSPLYSIFFSIKHQLLVIADVIVLTMTVLRLVYLLIRLKNTDNKNRARRWKDIENYEKSGLKK
jgi:hypothetical protein